MENLLAIFNKIQQVSPLPFFTSETVIVQNAGMQHWLNMSVAKSRGISMNIDYALPAQYLWKLLKSVASDEFAPEQSPYSREVLTWRIYQLLSVDTVTTDPDFDPVTEYWRQESIEEQALFKRYQLAQKLADLYEQYLIFRPEWVDACCKADFNLKQLLNQEPQSLAGIDEADVLWQGKLWHMLHSELPYNPVEMMKDAISNLESNKHHLPVRLSLFAINAMAPMWLNFLEKIGQYTQIHFYHLNPCFDYWGDLVTEKSAIKRLNQWTNTIDVTNATLNDYDDDSDVSNPLLANLGQQGREFIALLQSVSTIDVEAYEQVIDKKEILSDKITVLNCIQQDILSLSDKRNEPVSMIDDSIVVTSCHSSLREVQALHDWLLHQFNDDPTLTPKDVLVMCPQIEDYAPYVNAVFARGWQDLDEGIPPLPCSIADRNSKDSDPIVAAFLELLALPDSRFQVTHILGLLRLPSIQEKLTLEVSDVDVISGWLDKAAVHWGLDNDHKNSRLESELLNSQYTWQQGLSRLLRGFAFSDYDQIVEHELLLSDVEGHSGELLGKLMLFIEQLQYYLEKLSQDRSVSQWQLLLSDMLTTSFAVTNEFSINVIVKAIASLGEYTQHAAFEGKLPLTIVRDFLSSHFSEPDTSRQFMVGQVTFCSMLPMRSIPFKVIAIMGLNDGQYPRQRQPLAFDLIANTKPKLGDRSRRGDDRYLFLEAIISARKALYLSYQGRSIKTNTPKQPSIVLSELFDYLTQGYGWDLSSNASSQLRQTPMQAFSERNYIVKQNNVSALTCNDNHYPSFDGKWLQLVDLSNIESNTIECTLPVKSGITEISSEELIKFYQHPSKWYAKTALNLNFEQYDSHLSDEEPFVADNLAAYQLRESLLAAYLQGDETNAVEDVINTAILSGKYADTPVTAIAVDEWRNDSEQFANQIRTQFDEPLSNKTISLSLKLPTSGDIEWYSNLPISGVSIVCFRSSTPKFKDLFTMLLHQITLQIAQSKGMLVDVTSVRGAFFNTKSQKVVNYHVVPLAEPIDTLNTFIAHFIRGQQAPLLLNGALTDKVLTARSLTQQDLEKFWQGDQNLVGFGTDNYINYFWQQCPLKEELEDTLGSLFSIVYDHVVRAK